jgi:hypothetical protein
VAFPIVAAGLMGAGLVVRAIGRDKANRAEADIEVQNAAFYREQAKFAEDSGRRSQLLFDRDSVVLFGEQQSGLANAGVGAGFSSQFMGQQELYRDAESNAIKAEADMNVRLATLRAGLSDQKVNQLRSRSGQVLGILGDALNVGASFAGSYGR